MSAIKSPPGKKEISKKPFGIVVGILAAIGISLFVYLMWYVAPDEVVERVQVIALTESGCVVETFDGHAIQIDNCNAQPGEYITAPIDQKVKERANLMNPTT